MGNRKERMLYSVEMSRNLSTGISTQVGWEPATNIMACNRTVWVEVEVPGVSRDQISVTLQNGRELLIEGHKEPPRVDEPAPTYFLFEREFGHFRRRIVLDFPLDPQSVSSTLQDGVLTIRLSRQEPPATTVPID